MKFGQNAFRGELRRPCPTRCARVQWQREKELFVVRQETFDEAVARNTHLPEVNRPLETPPPPRPAKLSPKTVTTKPQCTSEVCCVFTAMELTTFASAVHSHIVHTSTWFHKSAGVVRNLSDHTQKCCGKKAILHPVAQLPCPAKFCKFLCFFCFQKPPR